LIDWFFVMDHLETEARNPASAELDRLTPLEIARLMNTEDAGVPRAVGEQAETIAKAIDVITARLGAGGRLIYVGAGTSGRLGVLDATECPPTFSSPPGQVVGLIAGGPKALTQAVEGAEDHPEYGENDLRSISLTAGDVVVGIATSGRTPYVLGAMDYARSLRAFTIGLACNEDSELAGRVDLAITVAVGPEVLSGSTRLKAGTATKLVLNMLTTGAMIRLGKTFGNLMVDLKATNEKLRTRTNRIVRQLTGLNQDQATDLLELCGGELKTALVTKLTPTDPEDARRRLQQVDGRVGQVLRASTAVKQEIASDLCLGIDGGGTKTVALLARRSETGWTPIARAEAGPSNIQTAGSRALRALDDVVRGVFAAAGLARQCVASACIGLAGAGRPDDRARLLEWAQSAGVAQQIEITTDAAVLLAAGTPEGWGLAVIAGTGSIALTRNADGAAARAGGWGPLLGDEGSAYQITLAGLRAVTLAADHRAQPTALTDRFVAKLGVATPQQMVPKIYGGLDRPALAALAQVVLEAAAAGDGVAKRIVEDAVQALAQTALAAMRPVFGESTAVPVALAGGMFTGSAIYRGRFLGALSSLGIAPTPMALVSEPADGALRLAQRALTS
jgi:N-acetylmuramic acid 6-phosphate etherase